MLRRPEMTVKQLLFAIHCHAVPPRSGIVSFSDTVPHFQNCGFSEELERISRRIEKRPFSRTTTYLTCVRRVTSIDTGCGHVRTVCACADDGQVPFLANQRERRPSPGV